jgi:hypothetical protein
MTTATFNQALKEVDTVPVGRLEELYQLIRSLTPSIVTPQSDIKRKKIFHLPGHLMIWMRRIILIFPGN